MKSDRPSAPAHKLLILAEMADEYGDTVYDIPGIFGNGAPVNDPAFAKRLAEELRKRMRGVPSRRWRDLEREANHLQRLKDWRGASPELAWYFEIAVRALAAEQPQWTSSGPKLGSTRTNDLRPYVNKAYAELVALALSRRRADWVVELFKRGSVNRPSRGKALVAQRALALALEDGKEPSRSEISAQIHEYVRTNSPPINALAPIAKRYAKRVRPSRPRLYNPWAE